jgi:hypothetical protein
MIPLRADPQDRSPVLRDRATPLGKKVGCLRGAIFAGRNPFKMAFFENNGLSAEFIRALTLQTIGMIHPSSDWQTEAA